MLAPDLDERHVFLCGPEPFAAEVKKGLQELNFDFANFHAESFGTGRVARGVKGNAKSLQLSEPRHRVRFTKSDICVETDETVNLLELAEAHGIEIEYACRSGSCGACEVRFSGKLSEKADFETTPTVQRKRPCLCLLQRCPRGSRGGCLTEVGSRSLG